MVSYIYLWFEFHLNFLTIKVDLCSIIHVQPTNTTNFIQPNSTQKLETSRWFLIGKGIRLGSLLKNNNNNNKINARQRHNCVYNMGAMAPMNIFTRHFIVCKI